MVRATVALQRSRDGYAIAHVDGHWASSDTSTTAALQEASLHEACQHGLVCVPLHLFAPAAVSASGNGTHLPAFTCVPPQPAAHHSMLWHAGQHTSGQLRPWHRSPCWAQRSSGAPQLPDTQSQLWCASAADRCSGAAANCRGRKPRMQARSRASFRSGVMYVAYMSYMWQWCTLPRVRLLSPAAARS